MSQNSRPAAQRSSTMRTNATRKTANYGEDISLAGPPAEQRPRRDPHNTYIEEGYRDQNPWMRQDEEQQNQEFSLAGTFPHKVRFQGKDKGSKGRSTAQDTYQKDEEKGEAEPAPQVTEAQNQHDEQEDQRHGTGDEQPRHEGRVDSSSTVVGDGADPGDQETQAQQPTDQSEQPMPSQAKRRSRMDAFRPNDTSLSEIADQPSNPIERSYNIWATIRQKYRHILAEWLGMTILVFIGVCADLAIVTSKQQNGTAETLYFAWGFAVMIGIYISGGGSGGFLNPALVLMLSVFRGFPAKRVPVYIMAEVVGAFTGALLALGIYRDNILHLGEGFDPASTGTYIYTQPQEWVSPATAFFTEFLCSAVFGCGILALGDSGNSPPGAGMHAFVIGLLVTTCTICGSFSTRACLNPARDLGPRVAAMAIGYPTSIFTDSNNWWIWGPWCGCMSGALTGGFMYDLCIFRGNESPVNYSPNKWVLEARKEKHPWMRRIGRHQEADELERKIEDGLRDVQDEVDL